MTSIPTDPLKMRNFVTFNANLPDDSEWLASGDILVPEGHGVAEMISSALSRQGLDCSSPEQRSYYGWEFEINVGTYFFLCVLQFADPWLLICEVQSSLKDRLLRKKYDEEFKTLLKAINAVLQGDATFTAVKWFTRQEYEAGPEAGLK